MLRARPGGRAHDPRPPGPLAPRRVSRPGPARGGGQRVARRAHGTGGPALAGALRPLLSLSSENVILTVP